MAAKRQIYKGVRFDSLRELEFGKRLERVLGTPIETIREQVRIDYVVPEKTKRYLPDFTIGNVHLEYKGRLTRADRDKLLWIQRSNPRLRIVIVFQRARNRIYKGSKTTYGEWATKNRFEWYDEESSDFSSDVRLKKIIKPSTTRKPKSNNAD